MKTIKELASQVFNEVECVLWTGFITESGYGRISISRSKKILAHRISWEIHRGPIPEGMCALHKCDVRACVNPNHLFTGSRTDNNRDMVEKGRNRGAKGSRNASRLYPELRPRGDRHHARLRPECIARGESAGSAKLNDEAVSRLRSLPRKESYAKLGKKYNVTAATMRLAIIGKTWTHIK